MQEKNIAKRASCDLSLPLRSNECLSKITKPLISRNEVETDFIL